MLIALNPALHSELYFWITPCDSPCPHILYFSIFSFTVHQLSHPAAQQMGVLLFDTMFPLVKCVVLQSSSSPNYYTLSPPVCVAIHDSPPYPLELYIGNR